MQIEVVTLFPELFESFLGAGLLGKAVKAGLVDVRFTNPRDFAEDRHKSVDDSPYGGGPGMVMMAPPLLAAIDAATAARGPAHRVLLTPAGAPLTQARVRELSRLPRLLLVCGRYEGVDERVRELAIDEELSIGDFVLTGGEPAAMALIDAVSRYVPGVLGDAASTEEESFSAGLLEYPHYTRPAEVAGRGVPAVLTGGDHAAVRAWREAESLARTRARRPDLWARHPASLAALAALAARSHSALLHHPVIDRQGQVVTTAITNLDIHDIARSSRTFGLAGYFVVTPVAAQRELAERLVSHWTAGEGREHNDKRSDALSLVRVVADLDAAVARITEQRGVRPYLVATAARSRGPTVTFSALQRTLIEQPERPLLLIFGTGWGLADDVFSRVDAVLEPITGPTPYNHLSVRSAVAIVHARLFTSR